MKYYHKVPLYLGLFTMTVSVLITVVTIGERKSLTSRAAKSLAELNLDYTSPNLVTLSLNSQREIYGVDVVIKFDSSKITISPSTLVSFPSYTTTGGIVDDRIGTFIFSALKKEDGINSGVVATFKFSPKIVLSGSNTELSFETSEGKTAIIDNITGENILGSTQGVKFGLFNQVETSPSQ